VPEGLISSFPVTCANGEYTIVPDLTVGEPARPLIDASVAELEQERDAVIDLGFAKRA
jgi:malate dehydrogenase